MTVEGAQGRIGRLTKLKRGLMTAGLEANYGSGAVASKDTIRPPPLNLIAAFNPAGSARRDGGLLDQILDQSELSLCAWPSFFGSLV